MPGSTRSASGFAYTVATMRLDPRSGPEHRYRSVNRVGLATLLAWLVAAACTHSREHPVGPSENRRSDAVDRPNVVLILCDDLGWGDLRAFDPASPAHTPHLDAMAAAGARLTRFYAAAPVCSPTRGSCLTGRHPFRYGVYSANVGHLPADEITLPELLREAGYTTGHFGKWHLGTLTTDIPDSNRGGPRGRKHFSPPSLHGYDRAFVTEAKVPTCDPMRKPANAPKTAWDALSDPDVGIEYGTRYWDETGEIVSENLRGDDSRVIVDRAIPFIESAVSRDQPFFAAIWLHAPHLPVVAGPEHRKPYADLDVYARNYFGCITALDEQVGRLRRRLRELGVSGQTLIAFASDNGPEGKAGKAPGSAGPFRGRKRSLYEGGVRVPAILEWPGRVQPGSELAAPLVTSDYLPTLVDALGIAYPDGRPLDGQSMLPLLEGQTTTRGSGIGFRSGPQRSWVTDRFKLYSADKGDTFELYDLLEDPGERTDLASDRPDVVARLAADLARWIDSCERSDDGHDYDDRASSERRPAAPASRLQSARRIRYDGASIPGPGRQNGGVA